MRRFIWAVLPLIPAVSICSAQGLSAGRIRNRRVKYVQSDKLRQYPVPPIIYERGGLSNKSERAEIIEKIIYPVINRSSQPVAAAIIEFFPDISSIGVTIVWHGVDRDGTVTSARALIERNKAGHFDADTYKLFFPVMN